jgi:serine/threonine-protein kinase
MANVGDSVGRFVIEAVLGEGGMGRVYKALDPNLGRRVALKVLIAKDESKMRREEAVARMMREARAAAAFNHPNVVAIYEVGEHEGNPYIAMELVAGTVLRDFVGDATTPEHQKLAWLVDVAKGLGAAHRAGLVHRDIKPDNVMITTDGVVKILDFGIARASDSQTAAGKASTAVVSGPALTAEGVSVGTPQYMAPEQIEGRPLDGRVDQFAWGVMAYEVIVGKLPWAASDNPIHLFAAVLTQQAAKLAESVPSIDLRVSEVVARAMEKKRDARFATMDELIAALGVPRSMPVSAPGSGVVSAGTAPATTGQAVAATPATGSVQATTQASATAPAKHGFGLVAIAVVGLAIGGAVALRAKHAHDAGATAGADAGSGRREGRAPATPQAAASYEAAEQAFHDGQISDARRNWEAAIASDPALGAAYLRLAFHWMRNGSEARARAEYQHAVQHRATLGEVDAALLDAYEPRFREPPDRAARNERLARVAATYADDPYVQLLQGETLANAGRDDEATAALERALAADPGYAPALRIEAEIAQGRGDMAAARALTDKCLKVAPRATTCLLERQEIASDEGRCADAKTDARAALAIDAASDRNYTNLAQFMLALGEPIDAATEVLKRAAPQEANESTRHAWELVTKHELAVLGGDLAEADHAAEGVVQLLVDHPDTETTLGAVDEIDVALEAGDVAHAKALLKTERARLEAADTGDFDGAREATVALMERRAGAIDDAALRARQDAVLEAIDEDLARRGAKAQPWTTWYAVYAAGTEDERDANEALAALPKYAPIDTRALSDAERARDVGKVYVLAGKAADALPLLERATHTCSGFDGLMDNVRAWYWLGLAREQTGDAAGARVAYTKLLDRWGKAKPRSVTAERAQARLASLKTAK